jgi:uncharacterized LabA/DUF88 family protein
MIASSPVGFCEIADVVLSKVKTRVGVFIDCENITYQYWHTVMSLANTIGCIHVAEGYCRPELKNSDNYVESARANKIHAFPVHKRKGYKAEIDMKMNNRIGYFLGQGRVDVFVVVASDGDYIEAILSLQRHGKRVVGVGKSFSNQYHIQVCDDFYDLGPF